LCLILFNIEGEENQAVLPELALLCQANLIRYLVPIGGGEVNIHPTLLERDVCPGADLPDSIRVTNSDNTTGYTIIPRVAQRDTYLAKTAPDKVSAMCRILSWNYAQEARSKGAVWVKQPVEPLIS
jgi:hypothetical protein